MSSYELMLDGTLISDINATSYVCGGLSTGKTYAIKVRAKNGANTGDWSSEIRITTGTGTTVKGTISTDTTWTAANSPYNVTGTVTVGPGVTLTIEAGTIVKFQSKTCRLRVNGALNAAGTSSSPVVFTSSVDTLYGGTSSDWTCWVGILISSTGAATIDHAIIRYVGWSVKDYPAISVNGKMTLTNSDIMNSDGSGIYLNSTADVTIQNNKITNTLTGIYIGQYSTGALTIENNTISDNTSYSIRIALPNFNPASFSGYEQNIFNDPQFFDSGSLNVDLTLNGDTNLVIYGKMTIPQGKTLTVQAGAVISTYINGITVNGILNSLGNISDKVVFKGSTSTLG
jgi:parallel beta-helix repeat protein